MNEDLTNAVSETFVKLHEDGIIYRANRLVNWCVKMNTTLSNLEVGLGSTCSRFFFY
jgi:valyl-tRNA synthetase